MILLICLSSTIKLGKIYSFVLSKHNLNVSKKETLIGKSTTYSSSYIITNG